MDCIFTLGNSDRGPTPPRRGGEFSLWTMVWTMRRDPFHMVHLVPSPNFEFEVPPPTHPPRPLSYWLARDRALSKGIGATYDGAPCTACLVKHREGLWIVLAFNAPKVIEECGINLSIIGGVLYFSNCESRPTLSPPVIRAFIRKCKSNIRISTWQ